MLENQCNLPQFLKQLSASMGMLWVTGQSTKIFHCGHIGGISMVKLVLLLCWIYNENEVE